MAELLAELSIHISYFTLGYSTFKELKKSSDINSEVLIRWAACTALFTIRNLFDFALSWIPWFALIKTTILVLLLLEKNICVSFFKSFLI
jgi:hypothetical protein